MEYNHYKSNTIKKVKNSVFNCFLLFTLTLTSFCVLGQNKSVVSNLQPPRIISFGEQVAFGNTESNAKWTVPNAKENIFASLTRSQITDYVFENTGDYEISYSENKMHNENECSHPHFADKMIIRVCPVKMTFDFSKITFSEKIRKGSNCDDIIITVPITVSLKDNQSAKFLIPNVMIAGVGSEINAKPIAPEVLIKNDIQLLKYQLSRVATKEAYLMFDFVDVNNNIQTYNQLAKSKLIS